ncbi:inositol oxygenase 2-like [Dorcoceras hygrometricum]|uniref:Inositol oxygenase n=1 Tax=Dorcoceras hygrometricum TaxID=472368 RepID=A0A2Z6ZST6_9LAMI|nr:inositol oxygenase 2-like [Dorcoceras hygrometricum]
MREEYRKLDKLEMSIWECCELLNDVVDDSDPDLDEPQIEHLLQTAEAIRKDYPDDDWLHLTALIHGNPFRISCRKGLLGCCHSRQFSFDPHVVRVQFTVKRNKNEDIMRYSYLRIHEFDHRVKHILIKIL